ncbi:MAG: hypothetical protein KDB00_22225 [Planctomycetales bacterium]|nr:hypothetical protein [Planctomycetales bacterium]
MADTRNSKLVIGKNDHWIIAVVAAVFLLALFALAISSCTAPGRSSSASAQKRQAQAIADREEELRYRDENGEMDWRARLDAAKEVLEQAQSNENWGKTGDALEQALDVARLMPPPSVDFDLQQELDGDIESDESQGDSNTALMQGTALMKGTAEEEKRVTNDEVKKMRKELEELFERLDGSAERSSGRLSMERDLIEIQ